MVWNYQSVRSRAVTASYIRRWYESSAFVFYTERYTTDLNNGFSGFLYDLSAEVKTLYEKQRKDIESITKIVFVAIDAFLRSVNSKQSRPGPFN